MMGNEHESKYGEIKMKESVLYVKYGPQRITSN
jgi:hypothetical protein